MRSFKPLITRRLILKRLDLDSKAEFFSYRSLPEVSQFQQFHPRSLEDAEAFIRNTETCPDVAGTWFQIGICLKETSSLIGDIGLHFLPDAAQAEIGFTIAPSYQGKGYALESVSAVIDYLFGDLRKHRITASVDPRNAPSVRLLERLGMRREAHFTKSLRMGAEWCDDYVFATLRDEWAERRLNGQPPIGDALAEQGKMLHIVQSQLAVDMNCTVDDLNGEKDSLVFVEARDNPGRRPFPRSARFFEIVSMGKSIVVSATPERLAIAKEHMQGKDRDTIFSLPFIRGLYLHYLPDLRSIRPAPAPAGFTFELVGHDAIAPLLTVGGFSNALIYNQQHPYHTVLVMLARKNGKIAGMAGACDVCERWRQIGVDILPEYRRSGLATYLVNRLALRLLEDGYVPVYDTISSNIASQRVAHRAGFRPAWVSDWRCDFSGLETSASIRRACPRDVDFMVAADLKGDGYDVSHVDSMTAEDLALHRSRISPFTTDGDKGAFLMDVGGQTVAVIMFRERNLATFDDATEVFGELDRSVFPPDGRFMEVFQLWVHPDHRRKGLATALKLEVESEARERHIGLVYTHTDAANSATLRLNESLGYREVRRGPIWDEVVRVSLVKQLL